MPIDDLIDKSTALKALLEELKQSMAVEQNLRDKANRLRDGRADLRARIAVLQDALGKGQVN